MWNNKIMPSNDMLLSDDKIQLARYRFLDAPKYESPNMLYWYDGPISFLAEYDNQTCLITKLDEHDNWNDLQWVVWAIIPISGEDIKLLRANIKALRYFWLDRPNFIVETLPNNDKKGHAYLATRVWQNVTFVTFREKWLP